MSDIQFHFGMISNYARTIPKQGGRWHEMFPSEQRKFYQILLFLELYCSFPTDLNLIVICEKHSEKLQVVNEQHNEIVTDLNSKIEAEKSRFEENEKILTGQLKDRLEQTNILVSLVGL